MGDRFPPVLQRERAVCCSRCAAVSDAQLQTLTAGTIWVGPLGYTAQSKIVPVPLLTALSPRERELLVALLLAHPGVATYDELADPVWPSIGVSEITAIQSMVGLLNRRIVPYGVRAVPNTRRGYHLVELRGWEG